MDYSQTNLIWFILPVVFFMTAMCILWSSSDWFNLLVKILMGWFAFHGAYLIWTLKLLG
jgi:hypothetical protein